MRRFLFNKAKHFIDSKKVRVDGETPHALRLSVGEYSVILKYKNNDLIHTCSCKSGSFNKICSHIIASYAYLATQKPTVEEIE